MGAMKNSLMDFCYKQMDAMVKEYGVSSKEVQDLFFDFLEQEEDFFEALELTEAVLLER